MKLPLFVLLAPVLFCQAITVGAAENYKTEKLGEGFWRIQAVQGHFLPCT